MQHSVVACWHGHSSLHPPQHVHHIMPPSLEGRLSRVQPSQQVIYTERLGRRLPLWSECSKRSPALHARLIGRTKLRECRASALSAIQHSDLATWTLLSLCAAASQVLLCQHHALCGESDSRPHLHCCFLCTQVIQVRTKLGSTVGSPILAIMAGLLCSMAGKQPVV